MLTGSQTDQMAEVHFYYFQPSGERLITLLVT